MTLNKERVRYFTNDRGVLEDNKAVKSGGQIVTNLLNGSALPVRPPTTMYQFRANKRKPVKTGSCHVETTDPLPHEMDSWFLSWGGRAIWNAAYQGLGGMKKQTEDVMTNKWVNIIAAVAGVLFAFTALVMTQMPAAEQLDETPIEKAVPVLPAVQSEIDAQNGG